MFPRTQWHLILFMTIAVGVIGTILSLLGISSRVAGITITLLCLASFVVHYVYAMRSKNNDIGVSIIPVFYVVTGLWLRSLSNPVQYDIGVVIVCFFALAVFVIAEIYIQTVGNMNLRNRRAAVVGFCAATPIGMAYYLMVGPKNVYGWLALFAGLGFSWLMYWHICRNLWYLQKA